jgi:iron-sulfur cluster assembly protein
LYDNREVVLNITVSHAARRKLLELQNSGSGFLRVNVIPGGCSGMSYTAMVDFEMNDADILVHEVHNIRIVTDSFSRYYLDGMRIDYSDDLIRPGFQLTNAFAAESCGCGASFTL